MACRVCWTAGRRCTAAGARTGPTAGAMHARHQLPAVWWRQWLRLRALVSSEGPVMKVVVVLCADGMRQCRGCARCTLHKNVLCWRAAVSGERRAATQPGTPRYMSAPKCFDAACGAVRCIIGHQATSPRRRQRAPQGQRICVCTCSVLQWQAPQQLCLW